MILVTGGIGYIGSHTVVELINRNYEVVILDNYNNSKPEVMDSIERITGKRPKFYEVDLLNEIELNRIFEENSIDAVIHFAGHKAVAESVQDPLKYYQNNIVGTINLLEIMKKHDVRNIVFSSSATVYGIDHEPPFSEDDSVKSINPYGRTKEMIEQILIDVALSDINWSIVSLRYFNPIGAHESGLIGEEPKGTPNNLMPYITQVAAGKREKLLIFGDDYDTPDGTGVRDYIHVMDLAKGHIVAIGYSMNHEGHEIFNLGTGKGYSVLEVLNIFQRVNNVKIPYEIVERRLGDTASCYADVSKGNHLLKWRADKNLEDMCRDAWNFERLKFKR